MKKGESNTEDGGLYIAGVGASVGGLDPIKNLIANLPSTNENLAVIVAQHISAEYQSKLKSLVHPPHNWTVEEACDEIELQPRTIYLCPGGHNIEVRNNKIVLKEHSSGVASVPSINDFFRSLAAAKGNRAIAVILSGSREDGAEGIKEIKAKKGLVLVQHPDEAQYPDMPKAALATGVVDNQLPAFQMGAEMEGFIRNLGVVERVEEKPSSLQSILRMLTLSAGTDFSSYKSNTIKRRISKRIEALKLSDTKEYYEYIKEKPAELNRLFDTMLIGVTGFLRDKNAFKTFRAYLEKVIGEKSPGDSIRIWSVGCATGEEPYSIAILLCEILGKNIEDYHIQIFATDIDHRALTLARKGFFKEDQMKNLTDEMRTKYFTQVQGGFELKKSLRQHVLFSRHDITADPPFIRMDLISCRNLLIYFNSELQQEVFPVLHYSLNNGGFLFLGKSESGMVMPDLFEMEDKSAKIFRKHSNARINTIRYSNFRNTETKVKQEPVDLNAEMTLEEIATETLVKKYEYPYVVVGEQMEVNLIKGSLQPYLELSEGSLNSNILKILNTAIHAELRSCFNKVKKSNEPCESNPIKFTTSGNTHHLRLNIKPLIYTKNEKRHYLIVFKSIEDMGSLSLPKDLEVDGEYSQALRIMELEQELAASREHLQAFTEELETGNEELQATNEELQSAVEELQSSNEELETSNEELQSANEELQTANAELALSNQTLVIKESELMRAKQELELVKERFEMALSNSRIFISYQDKDLKYFWHHNQSQRFDDIGIIGKTDKELLGSEGKELMELKSKVLSTGKEFQGELHFGSSFWDVSIKPIIHDNAISGVRTLANDISERKEAMKEIRHKQHIINGIIEESETGMIVVDPDFNIVAFNKTHKRQVEERFKKTMSQGDNLLEYLENYPEVQQQLKLIYSRALNGEKVIMEKYESRQRAANGSPVFYNIQLLPLKNDEEEIIGAAMMYTDISKRVMAEENIQYVIRHTANLTEEQFFNDLTDQMHRLFEAKHVYFAIYDAKSNKVNSKAYRLRGNLVSPISYDLENTPCGAVVDGMELRQFHNVAKQFPKDAKLSKWKAQDYLGVPICSPTTGNILGIFVMIHTQPITAIPNMDYLFNIVALRAGAELEAISNLAVLKARDKQLVNITRNLPEMIFEYISTPRVESDQFTFISEGAKSIYETSVNDLYREPQMAWDSIYEEDFEGFVQQMEDCAETLDTLNWTGRIVGRETFKLRWVKITARPEKIEGDSIRWYGIISDISRIKHIEQELKHAKKVADDNAAAKEEFLATMSHEIRTPLNGIVGITDIMISEASSEQMEYLNLLKFSAENLMTLINNILDFSKLNAGQIEVSEANIHLKVLLKNLKHAHMYRARENGNELNFVVDENIPDMVRGDDMILLQILNNLIGNAVKFTRSGEVVLSLNLVKDNVDSVDIRFEIKDTGVGIAEEDLEKIFRKFQQVGDKAQNSGGTGLGLAISKKLIDILDSDLRVKSKLGKGTSFFFTLKLKKAYFDKKADKLPAGDLELPDIKSTVNILLVEDVEENKNMLLRYFKKYEQLKTDSASNGKEAVEMLLDKDYDIVLMDLRMPVMDGREATSIIRSWENEKYRKLPIIALTADNFDAETETDFTDVITKPFSPRELRSKILEHVSNTNKVDK